MDLFSLHFSTFPDHASVKSDLIRLVRDNIPPVPKFSSKEQEAEYFERYSAQFKTTEDLFELESESLAALNRHILAFAQVVAQAEVWFETQFALIKQCDPANAHFAEMWHCHDYDFSVVYFLQIPEDLPFPQSYFTYLAPTQQYIKPTEGMILGMFQNVIHDGIKPWDGDYERIVIVSEMNIAKQAWHRLHTLDESQIDRDDPLLGELHE